MQSIQLCRLVVLYLIAYFGYEWPVCHRDSVESAFLCVKAKTENRESLGSEVNFSQVQHT